MKMKQKRNDNKTMREKKKKCERSARNKASRQTCTEVMNNQDLPIQKRDEKKQEQTGF